MNMQSGYTLHNLDPMYGVDGCLHCAFELPTKGGDDLGFSGQGPTLYHRHGQRWDSFIAAVRGCKVGVWVWKKQNIPSWGTLFRVYNQGATFTARNGRYEVRINQYLVCWGHCPADWDFEEES